jgi:formate dehydrogenase iron-sulfur subunit
MTRALLFDSTLCVGCRACEQACAERWKLPYDDKVAAAERLSENKLTTIKTFGEKYSRRLCMHCNEPTCASVCPVGALQKTSLGPVVYDEPKCIGCRYCMQACPFNVPVYEWSKALPRVKKCDLCFDRAAEGKPTRCSEACPNGATVTGDREALIAEAKKRLAEKPSEYHQKIYGLEEVGGTSVLMIGGVSPQQLGLPGNFGPEPLPVLTWRVLSHVPDVATLGSVLLGGVWWITHRREEVARAESNTGFSRSSPVNGGRDRKGDPK